MEPSIFTKILRREIPAEVIYEDEHTFVIPDKFPSMDGQLLVVTKRQVGYVFDLEEEEYTALMATTKKIAMALDRTFNTERTCIVIEGFEVPHIHVRLYPCLTHALVLAPRKDADDDTLHRLAKQVRAHIST
jgi:histidine triad (HIT) family protein